ncbi:MAG: hypothetical protein E4H36_05170 [Spirochaetales bacterium]|nr:MAG: hypothetical protein E4H36_05170 [Spirochaetales bacterium]
MRNGIKRSLILLFLLIPVFGGLFCAADEASELWSKLYKRVSSLQQKYEIMLNITDLHNRDLQPMLIASLDELNLITRAANTTEQRTLDEMKKIIVRELGNLKAAEAARSVWDVVKNTTDPFVRGEAITAIGMMRASDYIQELSLLLRNINMLPAADRIRDAEVTAYACVLALERFRDERGYRPVFDAADGWYSARSGVREKARGALLSMVSDPTDLLTAIVIGDSTFSQKAFALAVMEGSSAVPERKVQVAAAALRQGLVHNPNNVTESRELAKLRSQAVAMFISHGAKVPESVPMLEQVIKRDDADINERLSAVQALGVNGSEAAAEVLAAFLTEQNRLMSAGAQPKDPSYREVRATIQALGLNGSVLGRPVLMEVEFSNWPNTIIREAKAALEQLK